MDDILIGYEHNVDDYFNVENDSYYSFTNAESIEEIKNIQKIILNDFKIIKKRLETLKDNDKLLEEIETIIETYDNGIDFDINSGENYIISNDEYLRFNNYVNYINESLLASINKLKKTDIIVTKDLKNFIFVNTYTNILSATEEISFSHFEIENGKVVESHDEKEIKEYKENKENKVNIEASSSYKKQKIRQLTI